MVCLLFTMFVFFSIIMNVEGEEGNKENLFAGEKMFMQKKSFIIFLLFFWERKTLIAPLRFFENQTTYTFSFRYATLLGQFCDLVAPLVFILRRSMTETNLSGGIL